MRGSCKVLIFALTFTWLHMAWSPAAAAQSDFWQRFSDRKVARAQALAREAQRILKHERPSLLDPTSQLFSHRVAEALESLEQAARLAPQDPGILITYGLSLARYRDGDGAARKRALAALEEAHRLAPKKFSQDILFDLAILYSREQRFDQAIATYEKLLAQAIEPPSVTTLSNLAEMRMLSGDLAGAISSYRKALGLNPFDSGAETLARWGLGVALDRAGDHSKAIEEVKQAVQNSGGTLRVLDSEGVFFEPDYERHWYRALGYEALATTRSGLRKEELLYSAELELEAFSKRSRASGPVSPWIDQAEAHIRRLQSLRKRLRAPGAKRPKRSSQVNQN